MHVKIKMFENFMEFERGLRLCVVFLHKLDPIVKRFQTLCGLSGPMKERRSLGSF